MFGESSGKYFAHLNPDVSQVIIYINIYLENEKFHSGFNNIRMLILIVLKSFGLTLKQLYIIKHTIQNY